MEKIVTNPNEIVRIRTYINGLDENIQGGIPTGHIVLFSGSAGTMKSSATFNILYNEAKNNKKTGLYLSLEQSYASLINQVINMGYDFNGVDLIVIKDLAEIDKEIAKVNASKNGAVIIADIGVMRKEIKEVKLDENRSWINVIKNIVKKLKIDCNLELFTLDSLSALYVLSKFKNPRIELFYIFEFLRDLDLTTFLISEMPTDGTGYGEYDEDFLSDGIFHLRLTPFRRNVVREISVVKLRTSKINTDVFSLEFKNGQFHALYGGQNPLL
jgi:KaiC/GvpD/RAD55 family RecA-like ATPase